MANTPSANYTPAFQKAGLSSDPVDVTTGTVMPNALDTHDHTTNKGLGVARLVSGVLGSRPGAGNAGNVYVSTDTPTLGYDDGTIWHPLVYSRINEILGNGAITAFDFTSIPAGFRNLEIVVYARSGKAASTSEALTLTFNGDGAANYNTELLTVSTNTVASIGNISVNSAPVGLFPAASSTAGYAASARILIPNYAGTTFNKVFQATSAYFSSAAAASQDTELNVGQWNSPAAITRVTLTFLTGPILTGSVATLYGF